ncbi:MAG TPA: hypothetical protein VGF99_17075 [Myxococcota bacterium]
MSRDITGTNAQGSSAGPRPDQAPHAPTNRDDMVLDLADGDAELATDAEDDGEPEGDVDELGATVKGDGDRPVDVIEAKRRVHDNPSRSL